MAEMKENKLVEHIQSHLMEVKGQEVRLRYDKYGRICLTDMCDAYGKMVKHYRELKSTRNFINKMEEMGDILLVRNHDHGKAPLIETFQGGNDRSIMGTFAHPHIAIHLAMWLDAGFAIRVIDFVGRIIYGDVSVIKDITDYFAENEVITMEEHDNIIGALQERLEEKTEQLRLTNDEKTRLESIFISEDEFEDKLRNIDHVRIRSQQWKNEELYNILVDKLDLAGKKVKFDIKPYRDFTEPGLIIADWLEESDRGRSYIKSKLSTATNFIYDFVKRVGHCTSEDMCLIDYKTIKPIIFKLLLIIVYRAMENRISNICSAKKWRMEAIHLQDSVDDIKEELERKDVELERKDVELERKDEELAAARVKTNCLTIRTRSQRDEIIELKEKIEKLEFRIDLIEM